MREPLEGAAAFGPRLRHTRLDRGLSQSGLASGICSASAISRWESGHSLPSAEVLLALARRLNIDVHLLTGSGFDSRFAESTEGFADLLRLALGDTPPDAASPMASWVARARRALREALACAPDAARYLVDDLSLDPLTASTPATLEAIEVLDALVTLWEKRDAASASALIDVLSWATDAPERLRRAALEAAVAVLVMGGMPVAARGAVVRVGPPQVSETTRVILSWAAARFGGNAAAPLPPAHADLTARDVAFRLFARLNAQGTPPSQAAHTAAALLPEDALLARWCAWLGPRGSGAPPPFQGWRRGEK